MDFNLIEEPTQKWRPELVGVESTSLITLWARAAESELPRSAFVDLDAVRIRDQLDFDWRQFAKGKWTQIGIRLRTLKFDEVAKRFLHQFPEGTVIEVGAGLNTRQKRIHAAKHNWFDVDTEPVIELRKKLGCASNLDSSIVGTIQDTDWLDQVVGLVETPCLWLFEGVLMYFPESAVQAGIKNILARVPESVLMFDVLGKAAVRHQARHDLYRELNSKFYWGLDSVGELQELNSAWSNVEAMNLAEILQANRNEARELSVRLARFALRLFGSGRKLYQYVLLRSNLASNDLAQFSLNPKGTE